VQRSLVAFVLVAIVLVVFAPIVLGGQTWNDLRYHTEIAPPRIAAADAVLGGEVPTWWEGSALGVPLLGEPSHGAAYPIGWIAATPQSLDLLLVVHVLWCALGVALWARRRGASELGALVAGVLVATSGVIVGAALRGALPALAQLPWIALAASRVASVSRRSCRVRWTSALAALIGLVGLAGQLAVLAIALVLASLLLARHLRWLAIACVAGLAIASVQWLPAIFVLGDSAGATVQPMSLSRIIELVFPLRGEDAGWFPSVYVGAPVLVLAAFGAPRMRIAIFAGVLAVLAFVVGRGGWPHWLGAPELYIAALAIIAAAHAGGGFDALLAWRRRPGDKTFDLRSLLLVALVVAPTAGAMPFVVPTIDRAIVAEPPVWVAKAIAPTELTVEDGATTAIAPHPLRAYRLVLSFENSLNPVRDTQTLPDAIATLAGTSAAKWGIGAARSDDPARPAIHDRVWLAAAAAGGQMLDRYSIALAILPGTMVAGRNLTEIARRDNLALVRYPATPTASLVYEWIFSRDVDAALARLFPPGAWRGLGAGLVVLSGEGPEHQDEPSRPQPCTIERWSVGSIDLRCDAERDAYAVVSSSAAAGWSVTVDGRETPWHVADLMRRAVAVPAGVHRITWRYHAPGLVHALVLAALGITGILALLLLHGRHADARDRAIDPSRTDVE
jgi:hypothetical protein